MKGIHSKEQKMLMKRLRAAHQEARLTQKEMVQKLNYDESAISKIERGEMRVGAV